MRWSFPHYFVFVSQYCFSSVKLHLISSHLSLRVLHKMNSTFSVLCRRFHSLSVLTMEGLRLKQQRSGGGIDQEAQRVSKIFKANAFDVSSRHYGQTMLRYSSDSSKAQQTSFLHDFPILQPRQAPLSLYAPGYVVARCPEGVYSSFSGLRGPFTPSQRKELEHQTLIYNYLVANFPVPPNLRILLKKFLNPYALSSSSSRSSLPYKGFSRKTDLEPGRCRRTDGKKWRCSKEAVNDKKYCENHIDRGRRRSRKSVEGQTGLAVSGSTAPNVAPFASASASVMFSSRASNRLGATQRPFITSQPSSANVSANQVANRLLGPQGLSIRSPSINLKSKDFPFAAQKQLVAFENSNQAAFGLFSSDSLLNPAQKGPFMNSVNSSSLPSFTGQEMHDWTQLSMSIPITSSGFSSSSNSTQEKKLSLSPLQLAGQFGPIQMGLSVGNNSNESIWQPLPWGTSMGGPLGEVLNAEYEGHNNSRQMRSCPTGVLQKSSFISL